MIEDTKQVLLRKNHRQSMPRLILFLDTETKVKVVENVERHRMKIAWTCFVRRDKGKMPSSGVWRDFSETYPLCSYLQDLAKERTTLWIVAHNVFFDLQVSDFFYFFTLWGWELSFIYEKEKTYCLTIRKGKRKIICISTTNFFPYKLETLGRMVGIEKGSVDFKTVSLSKLSEYCRRDVEIIKSVFLQYLDFLQSNDLGRFGFTRASQSMNAYRHRFMDAKIHIHKNDDVVALERAAYFGGRVETRRIGEVEGGPFATYDVNSMYPFVMRQYQCPTRLVDFMQGISVKKLSWLLDNFALIAEVEIDTPVPIYATRHNNKVIFPVGRFTAMLCTHGLKIALERGHIRSVKRAAIYEKAFLFDAFVNFFFDMKRRYTEEKNEPYRQMCKIILNSLYGKFAQKKPVEDRKRDFTLDGYWRIETYDAITHQTGMEFKLFNWIVTQWGHVNGSKSLVAISAHITEAARLVLWSLIEMVGYERFIYCDTDSIKIRVSDAPLLNWPCTETDIGGLKLEKITDHLYIAGAKSYLEDGHRKIKGVPLSAREIGPLTFSYPQFMKQSYHMRQGITRFLCVKDVVKETPLFYDKGFVDASGLVVPFRLVSL